MKSMNMSAIEVAKQFVSTHFPDCSVAILTGSASRGEETPYSDLDILIISDSEPSAYVQAFKETSCAVVRPCLICSRQGLS